MLLNVSESPDFCYMNTGTAHFQFSFMLNAFLSMPCNVSFKMEKYFEMAPRKTMEIFLLQGFRHYA